MPEKESIKIEGCVPYDSDKFNQFSDILIETTRKYFTGDKVLYARVVEVFNWNIHQGVVTLKRK